jgi:hypothetical protein
MASKDSSGNYIMPPMSVLILEYDNNLVGIHVNRKNNNGITFYPNPTEGIITFNTTDPSILLSLSDLQGEIIPLPNQSNEQLKNGQFDLGFLKNGVYILTTKSSSGTSCQKLIISH